MSAQPTTPRKKENLSRKRMTGGCARVGGERGRELWGEGSDRDDNAPATPSRASRRVRRYEWRHRASCWHTSCRGVR